MARRRENACRSADALVAVLLEVRGLLTLPDTDFTWSSWETSEEAVDEIQQHLDWLIAEDYSHLVGLEALFCPTAAIQEASMGGGWSENFLEIAKRFDRELAKLKAEESLD